MPYVFKSTFFKVAVWWRILKRQVLDVLGSKKTGAQKHHVMPLSATFRNHPLPEKERPMEKGIYVKIDMVQGTWRKPGYGLYNFCTLPLNLNSFLFSYFAPILIVLINIFIKPWSAFQECILMDSLRIPADIMLLMNNRKSPGLLYCNVYVVS